MQNRIFPILKYGGEFVMLRGCLASKGSVHLLMKDGIKCTKFDRLLSNNLGLYRVKTGAAYVCPKTLQIPTYL